MAGDGEFGVGGVLNVSGVGDADLGREKPGHKLLARLEAAGIATSRSRGSMDEKDGAGEGLTTRKGVRAVEKRGGDGTSGESVDESEGRMMSAA